MVILQKNPANICWSWRRLQPVFRVTIFHLPRRLNVLKTSCKYVSKTSWSHLARRRGRRQIVTLKMSWRHDSNTSWRHVLKTAWRQTKYLLGIPVSNHGLLRNLNQYLTNLYFTNLRRIQNALIRTQWFLYLSYFETQSAELIQNQYCRTGEAIKTKLL